jgi:hypothetical protein
MAYPPIFFPQDLITAASATMSVTNASTAILIPSTATGSIYVTGLIMSNNATAVGSQSFGYGVAAVAPTTTAIVIQALSLAVNNTVDLVNFQPIKIPASNNFLITTVGVTTQSCLATYYVAP